jgi:hypothetical protein
MPFNLTTALGHDVVHMKKLQLPDTPVLNSAFKERGRADVVKIEIFPVHDGDFLKLTFESANSPWRQGVWLMTDGHLVVNQQHSPSVNLWRHAAPDEVLIECHTQNGCLHLYNIWDKGNGRESQSWTAGMLVEELPNGRRYRRNDIGFNTSFDKLVFRMERA